MSVTYVIQPPDLPEYLFKYSMTPYELLVEWANKEFQARLQYCAEHGYFKELKRLNDNWSPIRILAEMHNFRKLVSYLQYNKEWPASKGRTRHSIIQAANMRDMLFR
jgi:hypothetical protein